MPIKTYNQQTFFPLGPGGPDWPGSPWAPCAQKNIDHQSVHIFLRCNAIFIIMEKLDWMYIKTSFSLTVRPGVPTGPGKPLRPDAPWDHKIIIKQKMNLPWYSKLLEVAVYSKPTVAQSQSLRTDISYFLCGLWNREQRSAAFLLATKYIEVAATAFTVTEISFPILLLQSFRDWNGRRFSGIYIWGLWHIFCSKPLDRLIKK